MKTVIVTLELELSGEQAERLWSLSGGVDARQLLRDALGEFIGLRGGESLGEGERAKDEERALLRYVLERYPDMDERRQRQKAREVCKRKAVAALLRHSEVTLERSETE